MDEPLQGIPLAGVSEFDRSKLIEPGDILTLPYDMKVQIELYARAIASLALLQAMIEKAAENIGVGRDALAVNYLNVALELSDRILKT